MRDHIVIKGARENNLKNIDVEIPPRCTGRHDRPVRLGQVEPCVRHHLCRGTEALYGEPLVVCTAVSRPDGQAGRGLHRGPVARPFPSTRRPPVQKPALDRRHGHGDLRLSASALGARRRAALPEVRQGDPPPDGRPDRRSDRWRCRRRTRVQILAPVVRARKGEHAEGVRRCPPRRAMSACAWTAASTTLRRTITLDKNRKHNIEIVVDRVVIRPDQNRRLTDAVEIGVRALRRSRASADIPEDKREIALLAELRLRRLRHLHRGAHAADVLVQQPLRRLPDLRRPGHAAARRPGAHHSGPVEVHPRRRHHRERLERHRQTTASRGCISTPWRRNITFDLRRADRRACRRRRMDDPALRHGGRKAHHCTMTRDRGARHAAPAV